MTDAALLSLPIGIPWLVATALALLDGRKKWVGWFAVFGLGLGLATLLALTTVVLRDGPVAITAGGWPLDVGITLRADALGLTFAIVSVIIILMALLFELALGVQWRSFPALALFMAAGLTGLFITSDAFNFYVFFEIAMTAAFIMTAYRETDDQVRGAFVFVIVNLLGSVFFLSGVTALYSVTGSLDMTVIAERVARLEPSSVIAIAAIIFAAFCLKLGLFPFHFWLPTVYVGSHAPVAAILSGALANIGAYGLLRFGGDILPREFGFAAPVVMILGAASIVYGSLQSVSRRDASEILAYSAIGQAGYVLLAIGIGGPAGYAAAVIYAVLNALTKGVMFLATGIRGPIAGVAFAIGAFSVCGVPPLAGFLGKLGVFRAATTISSPSVTVLVVALVFVGSALSFLYSFQVYQRRFLKPTAENLDPRPPFLAKVVVMALASLLIVMGVWPEPLIALSQAAAAVLTAGGAP